MLDDFEFYPASVFIPEEPEPEPEPEPEEPETPDEPEYIGDYMLLKCNFHTHTTTSDGQYTPTQVVNLYHDRGYDVLAITDHNTISGYAEAKFVGDSYGMRIICGEEVTCLWADGTQKHVVSLFNTEQIGLPRDGDIEVPVIFDAIHSKNGIAIVAHPWREWDKWQDYQNADYIEGWEVDCTDTTNWVFNTDCIYTRVHDFHFESQLYTMDSYWTYLLAENDTEAGIREALDARRIIVYDNGELYGSTEALAIYNQVPEEPEEPQPTAYDLDIIIVGSGSTVPLGGSYLEGTNIEVTATPNNGWTFSYWILDNSDIGNVNPVTVTMNSDHNLVAVFTETQQIPEGMTAEDWESFWTGLKDRQAEPNWANYLEQMLELWKSQNSN